MKLVCAILCLSCMIQLPAQDYLTKKEATGKVKKLYEKASALNRAKKWDEALKMYDKVLAEDPSFIDIYLAKAAIQYDQKEYETAVETFQKALAIDSKYYPRALYQIALTELKLDRYASAAVHLNQFIEIGDKSNSLINRAQKYLANANFAAKAVQNPVPFKPILLNSNINTNDPEYLPALTADGQNLIFTRRVGHKQEDLFLSKLKDGVWQPAQPLSGINTPSGNEGTQSISADGRFIVYTVCERDCNLYYSFVGEEDRWSIPEDIGEPINTGAWDSQPSISSNGKALFFASERKGGQGGRDLWVSYIQSNGRWGIPQNLGPMINTPGDEASPFIHPDGQTLYFHSNGLPGMGGFDLYFSKLQPDGSWSEPINLGYPINTKANEGALIVSLDGTTAFFATDKKLTSNELEAGTPLSGDADIYQFDLYPEVRPQPVTYVKGTVFDAITKTPLQAIAEIATLDEEDEILKIRTNKDGSFLLCLTAGKDYSFNVNKKSYLFYSEHFALRESNNINDAYILDIPLIPIPTKEALAEVDLQPVILKNVFFETGSAELLPQSRTELNKLKTLLDQNQQMSVQINGHTDNIGSEGDNLTLSEHRAKAVHDYLIAAGIAAERLSYKGFGEERPIATNDTEAGRQQNRRTEFVQIKN